MLQTRLRTAALALLGVTMAGVPGVAGGAADAPAAGLSEAEFARLHKQLSLKNQPWATIPWKVSLTEARQRAAAECKPIFLVVNTGNCLGWT
jgi:hypothetical protein